VDPVKIGLVGYGRYAVAPLTTALDVLEATRVIVERHTVQGLGTQL
jgi:hypothetical protein